MTRAPVISISHGGGPLPLMKHASHTELTESLISKVPQILHLTDNQRPKAIIVVTAHWQEPTPTISGAESHPLLFDYYGFPPYAYDYKYDAPGSPSIAKEVFEAMEKEGLKPKMDMKRGWDHGVFVPLLLINKEANIPIIQISVLPADSESPADLFNMGTALGKLRDKNYAIIGSGLATFHNMQLIQARSNLKDKEAQINDFSKSLSAAVTIEDMDERKAALGKWREMPSANLCHQPGAGEHLFPLIVCAGAGGRDKAKMWVDHALGHDLVSYYWSDVELTK